nr:GNAT family N-acetyltransferase [Nakamurella flavida]
MNPHGLGGDFWGLGGGRDGLLFAGSTMVPLAGSPAAMRAFAAMAGRRKRGCATILGRAELVLPFWRDLEPRWGPARDVRADQPLLTCVTDPAVAADDGVEVVRPERFEEYYPAAVAMFTEEVGVDPRLGDGGRSYRARVTELIGAGRAYARFDGEHVLFKAEVGALSRHVAVIQGVWMHPAVRGQGLAAAALAAVVRSVQQDLNRLPSLYVNAHNTAARALYARIGFEQVGTFASVLF